MEKTTSKSIMELKADIDRIKQIINDIAPGCFLSNGGLKQIPELRRFPEAAASEPSHIQIIVVPGSAPVPTPIEDRAL